MTLKVFSLFEFLAYIGLALVVYGCYLIHPPTAAIVAGLLIFFVAAINGVSHANKKSEKTV